MSDTVRVRIAVAVQPSGGWYAYGTQDEDDSEKLAMMEDWDIDTSHIVFVEADIPLPKAQTVEGEVK